MKTTMKRKQSGLSLIEMLVAMAILGILLAVIVQFFASQSRAARLQKAINEASEAGRTAMSLITWDLQNAGYRVTTSNANPAIKKGGNNGYSDSLQIRYRDDSVETTDALTGLTTSDPTETTVSYSIVDGDLLRDEDLVTDTVEDDVAPSVASIVAMNVRYETRTDQFVTPTSTSSGNTCPSGTTAITDGSGSVINCSVDWAFADEPARLVRQVKVQLLARSENKVSGAGNTSKSYYFDGVSSPYVADDGYAYQFTEQTIIVPNLGR